MLRCLHALDRHFPIRYLALLAMSALLMRGIHLGLHTDTALGWAGALMPVGTLGLVIGMRDLRQTRLALLRNHPAIGHLRFLMEWIRPEIGQYFPESDGEAVPFSRQ